MDLWDAEGFSLFAVDRKPDGKVIGWTGVTRPHWFPEMMPTPEIGWFIDRELWGQGFVTEGAAAALRFAFQDMKIERVIGIYNANNAASGRVMENPDGAWRRHAGSERAPGRGSATRHACSTASRRRRADCANNLGQRRTVHPIP